MAVAKKAAKRVAKKPAKKVAKKAVSNTEMQARLKDAEVLMQRMRDAGVPAGSTSYMGALAYGGSGAKTGGHHLVISNGEATVIHGLSSGAGATGYQAALAYAPSPPGYVSSMAYGSQPTGDGIVTVHIKPGGHMLVRTGDEARKHAHDVLNRFNQR